MNITDSPENLPLNTFTNNWLAPLTLFLIFHTKLPVFSIFSTEYLDSLCLKMQNPHIPSISPFSILILIVNLPLLSYHYFILYSIYYISIVSHSQYNIIIYIYSQQML